MLVMILLINVDFIAVGYSSFATIGGGVGPVLLMWSC